MSETRVKDGAVLLAGGYASNDRAQPRPGPIVADAPRGVPNSSGANSL
jgi:hypothetical protein